MVLSRDIMNKKKPVPESWMSAKLQKELLALCSACTGELPMVGIQNHYQLWQAFHAGELYQRELSAKEAGNE